jgi:hypothetical protein
MRFNEKRALAFAEYTITAILKEAAREKKSFIKITRSDFSNILDTQKLRSEHVDLVRKAAAEQGVGMANMGHCLIFFSSEQIENEAKLLSAKEGRAITDRFEKLYGSAAADEMWEDRTSK